MSFILDIILAVTPEKKEAAELALRTHNATRPSDLEVVAGFLKDCTTLDGKPLALDTDGSVVERND